MEPKSFNPHWVDNECCRDYRIGNIIITSVPDKFVLRSVENRRHDALLNAGHVDEFVKKTIIKIPYNKAMHTD